MDERIPELHDAFSGVVGRRVTWTIEPRVESIPGRLFRAAVALQREGADEGLLFSCLGDYATEDEARRRAVEYGKDWVAANPFA